MISPHGVIASPQQTGKAEQSQQTDPTVIVMFVAIWAIIRGGGLAGSGSIGNRRSLADRAKRRQGERSRDRGVGA